MIKLKHDLFQFFVKDFNMSYDGLNMWNNWSKSRKRKPVYDKWLDEYEDV